jgi:hypothetical protein
MVAMTQACNGKVTVFVVTCISLIIHVVAASALQGFHHNQSFANYFFVIASNCLVSFYFIFSVHTSGQRSLSLFCSNGVAFRIILG